MAGKLTVNDLQGFNESPTMLSRPTVEKIRRAVEKIEKIPENRITQSNDNLNQAPEVYIARVPDAGIPALGEGNTGTASDDAPGSADCDIYKINDDDDLERVATLEKTVYNLSTKKIMERWVPVFRDKFGKWLAQGPQGVNARFWFTANGSKTSSGVSVAVTVVRMLQGDQPTGTITAHDPGVGYTTESGTLGLASVDDDGKVWIDFVVCASSPGTGT